MGGVKRSSSRKIAISDFKGILANLSQFQPPPPHFQGGHNFCPIYIFCILVVSSFCRSFLDHNIICLFPTFRRQSWVIISINISSIISTGIVITLIDIISSNIISNVPPSSSLARSNICPQSLLKETFGSHYKGEKFRPRIAKPCFPRY